LLELAVAVTSEDVAHVDVDRAGAEVRRVERLGLPVTAIVPGARKPTKEEIAEDMGRFNAGGF
jgi:hypothetical protein